jgi:hypothetical protein
MCRFKWANCPWSKCASKPVTHWISSTLAIAFLLGSFSIFWLCNKKLGHLTGQTVMWPFHAIPWNQGKDHFNFAMIIPEGKHCPQSILLIRHTVWQRRIFQWMSGEILSGTSVISHSRGYFTTLGAIWKCPGLLNCADLQSSASAICHTETQGGGGGVFCTRYPPPLNLKHATTE